jgi:hypothetical protein
MSKNSADNVLSKLFPARKSKRSGRPINPVRRPGDDDGPSGGGRGRGRGGARVEERVVTPSSSSIPSATGTEDEFEVEGGDQDFEREEDARDEEAREEAEREEREREKAGEEEEGVGGAVSKVWLRGESKVPRTRPATEAEKLLIVPDGTR